MFGLIEIGAKTFGIWLFRRQMSMWNLDPVTDWATRSKCRD